jgi:hypothetical protein
MNAYLGDYGIGNKPEAVSWRNGRVYYSDMRNGSFLRLSADGNTPISQYGVSQEIGEYSQEYLSVLNSSIIYINVGVDPDEGDVYFSHSGVTAYKFFSQTRGETAYYIPGVSLSQGDANPPYEATIPIGYKLIAGSTPQQKLGDILSRGHILIGQDDQIVADDVLFSLDIVMTQGTISFVANYNIVSGEIKFETLHDVDKYLFFCLSETPNVPCPEPIDFIQVEPKTLGFNEAENAWWGKIGLHTDEGYQNVSQFMFSFLNGEIYIHDNRAVRCNFFGVQQEHYYLFGFGAPNEDTILEFKSISTESSEPFDVEMETNKNKTSWLLTDWEKREDDYYKDVMNDENATSSANVIGIGEVSAIVGNLIAVDGFNPAASSLRINDPVYSNGTLIGTIVGVNTSVIELSTTSGLVLGSKVYAQRSGKQHGDNLRGHWATIKLSRTSADFEELYAINVRVIESKFNHS